MLIHVPAAVSLFLRRKRPPEAGAEMTTKHERVHEHLETIAERRVGIQLL